MTIGSHGFKTATTIEMIKIAPNRLFVCSNRLVKNWLDDEGGSSEGAGKRTGQTRGRKDHSRRSLWESPCIKLWKENPIEVSSIHRSVADG